jgi:uncharacterized protein YdeI (YjbR/CyaY-like superfamily)
VAQKIETHKDLVVLTLVDYKSWLSWLAKNHNQETGVWVKFAKKGSGETSLTYEEAREGAIIYGWIDGLINSYTEKAYLRKFTQRRAKSSWSKINREIVEQLIRSKKIKPAGLAQVEAAKQDGRWAAAYDSPSTIKTPPELLVLLKKNKKAQKFFDSLSSANRYAFLYRIQTAKKPETRERHLKKTMEMLEAEKVYHPKLRKKK